MWKTFQFEDALLYANEHSVFIEYTKLLHDSILEDQDKSINLAYALLKSDSLSIQQASLYILFAH